ncbi:MAG: restriction endonuclease subunit S [Flavobacteriales bacterium]|nr:restriction endonuclease subunit S [Flavobacteriales bacterium]
MSSYTISPTLNKSRVFILPKSELEKRFDPMYYAHEYNHYDKQLSKKPFKKFHQILKSINNGYDFRDYKESGTPYLKVANVKQGELDFTKIQYIDFNSSEISKNIQLKKGNLLLTRKGTFGNAFALDKDYDFVISSEVFYIELQDNSINPKFLEIFFNSKIGQAQFDKNKIGAIMGSLSQEAIRDLKIPLPSSEIQNQIVGIYESYVAQKQKNEAEANKLLSSIDDYLLKELGIKLPEPPENTLKNRMFVTNISELSGNRYDPNYHQKFFQDVFSAFEKGKYEYSQIRKYASFQAGYAFKSSDYLEQSNCLLITIKNIRQNQIDIEDATYLPDDFFEQYKEFQIRNNDLLIAMTGATIGKVGIYNHPNNSLLNQRNGIIKPDNINSIYLMSLLNLSIFQKLILRNSNGGAQPNISETDIMRISIPVPPLDKQKEIAEHITSIRQQAQQLKDKTKELLKKASEEIERILLN